MESNDLMICDICMESYDDAARQAKMLDCHHSFCESCLNQLSAKDQHQTLDCPTCRHITPLTEAGVSGLQSNFYICFMRDTLAKLGAPKIKGCVKHSNQPLSFFCSQCAVAICRDCTVLDHQGELHQIINISTADQQQREALTNQSKEARVTMATARAELSQLEAELGNLSQARDSALQEIDSAFETYAKMLETRKQALVAEAKDIYAEKQSGLASKREKLFKSVTSLSEKLTSYDAANGSSSLAQVIEMRKQLQDGTGDTKAVKDTDIGKCTNYIQAQTSVGKEELVAAIKTVGKVISEARLPSRVMLSRANSREQLVASLPISLKMKVQSYGGEKLADCQGIGVKVTDSTNQKLAIKFTEEDICFTPTVPGDYTVQPMFLQHPIKSTSLKLNVKHNNPVAVYGGKGHGYGTFHCPRAVQVDKDGNLFIADTGNRVIQKLNTDGKFVHQFRIDGGNAEYSTCDLGLSKTLDMVVCTETAVGTSITPTSGNTIAIYGLDGKLKNRFTNKALKCSLCVAVNSRGDVVVSDYLVHSLFMYDAKGTFLHQIGRPSSFSHPAFICIGKEDSVIVSDTNNDTVQVFDHDGRLLRQFGEPGGGPGQLKQPFGVATDGVHILVVDSGNHRLQVFDYDGTFVSVIDSHGAPFNQPRGIALTDDGHVYVADRDNHVIKKYRYK